MDGTLADSEPLHQRTLVSVLHSVGVEPGADLLDDTVGLAEGEVYALCTRRFGVAITQADWVAFRNAAYAIESRELKARAGAVDVLRGFAATRRPQAIVSNSCRAVLELSIRGLGLQDMRLSSVSRNEVENPKPHPEPYLFAASLMGVHPHDVLVVEDSPVGATAGLAAGMSVLAWPAPGLRTETFPAECFLVHSHAELRAFIESATGERA